MRKEQAGDIGKTARIGGLLFRSLCPFLAAYAEKVRRSTAVRLHPPGPVISDRKGDNEAELVRSVDKVE